MKILRSIFLIINYKTFLISGLSVASTFVCHQYGIIADFPLDLVSVAIVFPIVFSINSAYKRREDALTYIADIKAHGLSIFYASRDWVNNDEGYDLPDKMKLTIRELFTKMREMFVSDDMGFAVKKEREIQKVFSELSHHIQDIRPHIKNMSEMSRANQYLSKMMISFEKVKNIYHYRTPITLRAYSKGFIYTFPVIFSPFFASTFTHYQAHLAYWMPIIYSFILVSLDNIQDHLEHPFDMIGEDDVRIEIDEYMNLYEDQ